MERELRSSNHSKHLILYHLIFVAKYRRKIFSNKEFGEGLKNRIVETSKKNNYEIETLELDYTKPDHIHILVRSDPSYSPAQIVRLIKQDCNKWAWDNYSGWLKSFYYKAHHLFTKSYFCCSCGNASAETIQEYINSQGGKK